MILMFLLIYIHHFNIRLYSFLQNCFTNIKYKYKEYTNINLCRLSIYISK
ncbi:hypothetical protein C923_01637 [Plasmodium falciparum UGT5.1]|uniref:Uncharacterized protein n=1 Tax=Plasmodium falciparum UGT5.1 TaxID=1237627 RepID=W7JS43_PLAFA|nr:hypothetical protein C923_01637 [Plasmodium falciparum UGT5.1]